MEVAAGSGLKMVWFGFYSVQIVLAGINVLISSSSVSSSASAGVGGVGWNVAYTAKDGGSAASARERVGVERRGGGASGGG